MPLVTATEVRVILPASTTLTDPQIDAAILAADCIVSDMAVNCLSSLSAECLKQVELYLAAHFAAVTDNTLSISSERDACCGGSATYGFEFGKGIMGTPFGQMANTLSMGCLQEYDKRPVDFYSIGTHGNDSPLAQFS